MPLLNSRLPLFGTALRVLTFRATREELLALDRRHLTLGLVSTWLVGMGRYWDSPRAELLQKLGVGSVLYVFALAIFLWLILWPLRPQAWSFFRLLTFITLVSPPAALYAIPVEQFLSLPVSQSINAWFLALVAVWRVALLFFFLMRVCQLRWFEVVVASLMPLAMIVCGLWALNLEHVVFELMSGIRPEQQSANDGAYMVLFVLTMASLTAFPVLLIGYLGMVVFRATRRRRAQRVAATRATEPALPLEAAGPHPASLAKDPSEVSAANAGRHP